MSTVIKTYRFRLFTNKTQERELSSTLETHRRVYNECLSGKTMCWQTAGVDWNYYDQSRWLTAQRKTNRYLANLNSGSTQQTLTKLDRAFKSFFERCKNGKNPGYPRFKSRDQFNSFSYPMTGHSRGCKIVNRKLRLQNIGTIRVRWHREIPSDADIRQTTIKRVAGKWFACFYVETGTSDLKTTDDKIGIDLGLNAFVMTSEGEELGDSKTLKFRLPELRRNQRALLRCRKGSNRRKKVKRFVTNLHEHVANTRRDMHHKAAHQLVSRYGFIAAENLNVQGMLKNRRLARSVADAGWSSFISILKHKAECAGAKVVLVDARNTSQDCSQCGHRVQKSLAVRTHICDCGCVLDRDVNAARNILARGLARTEPDGLNVDHKIKRVRGSRYRKVAK